MPKRTRSYNAWQLDRLTHPEAAASYLNAALADSQEMFLLALRKVAQAREMASVAKEAGVQRETLYHALSKEGNPTLTTLRAVLSVLDLELDIFPKRAKARQGQEKIPLVELEQQFQLTQDAWNLASPQVGFYTLGAAVYTTGATQVLSQGMSGLYSQGIPLRPISVPDFPGHYYQEAERKVS